MSTTRVAGARLWQALLALSLVYASTISVFYVFQSYPRHRVETGWLVLAALALLTALTRWQAGEQSLRAPLNRRALAVMLAGALLLYAPSLTAGLLSDDYVLLAFSERWEITPAVWDHFRPLSLAVWAALTTIGSGPVALHALSVALHGLNAFLIYWLERDLGEPAATALAAAALWLAFPGSVEAVTWLSGGQDVLMAAFVLAFLIAAVRARLLVAMALLILATLTKETAVCAPVLLVLLRSRRYIAPRTIVAAAAWCVLFAIARLYLKPDVELFDPVSGYFVKQLLAGLFGSLAMPWMREQMFAYPWLMAAIIIATAVILAIAILRVTDRVTWTSIALWAGWALAAVLPVYRYFYVSPDLQGSRHLYLPAAGWALLLASVGFRHIARPRGGRVACRGRLRRRCGPAAAMARRRRIPRRSARSRRCRSARIRMQQSRVSERPRFVCGCLRLSERNARGGGAGRNHASRRAGGLHLRMAAGPLLPSLVFRL